MFCCAREKLKFKLLLTGTVRLIRQRLLISPKGPRGDSGSAGAKKVLDALENETKANFQEKIPGKVQFQKKLGE